MDGLLERYAQDIVGELACFDRVMIWGNLPDIGYAEAAMNWLFSHKIRICAFGEWTKQCRDKIEAHVKHVAQDNGLGIQFVTKRKLERKEDYVARLIQGRPDVPGLVCILSAMEQCPCYRYHRHSGKVWKLRGDTGKCLHYYFYFIDKHLGLCSLRLPTWAPFRIQFYCNGHSALHMQLKRHNVEHTMEDNAFVQIQDLQRAQRLSAGFSPQLLRDRLEHYTKMVSPIEQLFPSERHWTLRQVEYSTDIIFKSADKLSPLYENIVREAIHTVKADDVARFLGKRLHPKFDGEVTSSFSTRIEMTRIKHQLGPVSVKMYDKRGRVLRIETTCNDMSFFKHYREVVHRDGSRDTKLAGVKKTIYSLEVLRDLMSNANRRYLDFLSSLDDKTPADRDLEKITRTAADNNGRKYRGLNFFAAQDAILLEAIIAGQWQITGISTRWLSEYFPRKSRSWVGRQIKRLRVHNLLRKVPRQLKYHLTELGKRVVHAALATRNQFTRAIVPALAQQPGPSSRSRSALAVRG